MLNPSQWTIGELSSAVKDYGIFATVCFVGWKARGLIQPGIDLFKKVNGFIDKVDARFARADKHMLVMESSMSTLLNNHLAHLKSDAEPTKQVYYASGIEGTADSDGNRGASPRAVE